MIHSLGFWQPILIFAVLNAMLALGLYVTLTSGQLSVAHAAIAGIGGYSAAILTTNFGWPFWAAVLAAVAAGSLVGAGVCLMTLRMTELVASLATLGFGETAVVVAYNLSYVGGALGFSGIPPKTTLSLALAALILTAYVVYRFERSRLGLAARAVRENPLAAAANGIGITYVKVVTFALGGAIAGAAGALQAHYALVVTPDTMSFAHSLNILIYVIFGGSYTLWGAVVGAGLLTILPEALRFSEGFRFVLYGLLIAVTVLWRPQGLLTRRRG